MDKCKIRELWFQVNTLRRAALRPYFQEIGLTVGQGQPRILNSLRKYGTMTQRELADCCFVDVTRISRTVDRLVAAGLLSKQIDPECRRSCLISLTEEGRKKAVQVQHIFEKGDEIWWKSFDEEELERLYQYLLKMEQSLKGDQGK
ncbi:MarR family transcriptional regulator [Sellimonas intestinalis]|uniref:MarR family transcriptional regulator n=1 Tax=Sellimonas intestinalis TaxID=1653434 RepID=A0A3E3K449_9FIRM|nr:MarR family winged helix-turn-helix transcriptional regulator [Sellimonas intestinalis]RGE88267.1 MarR family transcriptional regulator [Sellimonas intestinalis]RGE88837.1 MarR family transcriptional regulator [Sellimonas intestinalis]